MNDDTVLQLNRAACIASKLCSHRNFLIVLPITLPRLTSRNPVTFQ